MLRIGVLRAVAIGLTTVCLACGPEPSAPPMGREPLWVAVVQTDGVLIPIARHDGGVWDLPWPAPFDQETAALDPTGEVGPPPWLGGDSWTLPVPPMEMGDPGGGRIAAPLGWSFYSQTERGAGLTVARLLLVEAHCMMQWALGFEERELFRVEGTPAVAGVAFNRPREVVSAEDEIPELDRLSAELGLVDSSDPDDPTLSGSFVWLGFYRLDNGVIIGVVNDRGYEGEGWLVVEIDGDRGRIVHRVYGGGC